MNMTKKIRELDLDASAFFPLAHYDTLITICVRLRRSGHGEFKVKSDSTQVRVTRTTLPDKLKLASELRSKEIRHLKAVSAELKWVDDQADFHAKKYDLYLSVTGANKTQRFNISVGKDLERLIDFLQQFIDYRTDKLKKG